ncbi:MAG TPA: TlpA disulfide reductase family protein [Polyangiaceae bacterium]
MSSVFLPPFRASLCGREKSLRAAVILLVASATACSSEAIENPGDGSDGGAGASAGARGAVLRSDPVAAPYPSGPYGRNVGSVIQNLSFLGWRDGAAAEYDPTRLEVVSLSDYYNPDGSGPVKLVALNASAVWCTVCRAEYRQLERDAIYETFRPKGVEILGVLFEDSDYEPAKPDDLAIWGGPDAFQVPFPLVIDPGFKTGAYFETDATPMNMLIDTRTMQILDITMGYDTAQPDVYWSKIDRWLGQ